MPPLVTMPPGVLSVTASAWRRSSVMAMISPVNLVALGHTSRCSAFTCANRPKTSFM